MAPSAGERYHAKLSESGATTPFRVIAAPPDRSNLGRTLRVQPRRGRWAERNMPQPGTAFEQSLEIPATPQYAANIHQASDHVAGSGCLVISATGEFDLETRDKLLATLEEQPWHLARTIIVDLTNATFCDARV